MLKEFPVLYAKSKNGKTKQWRTWVCDSHGEVGIYQEHGYTDGKKQVDLKNITKGKNIGKSNETTPWDQACSDAQSRWNKKKDKGYTEDENATSQSVLLPMLAQKYNERKHKIEWPAYVQPKLNGVRCLSYINPKGELAYQSRGGKFYTTLPHLEEDIMPKFAHVLNTNPLDGEIYIHGETFQEITRRVKKDRGENTQELQYWIYDIASDKSDFKSRLQTLIETFQVDSSEIVELGDKLGTFKHGNLVLVPTIEVQDEKEMMKEYANFISMGFEGIIIRNTEGKYLFNHRSNDLQKYKNFKDDEFVITGGEEASGREHGCVIFQCKTKSGKLFKVRPRGSLDTRRTWMQNISQLIGKKLTVRYLELSEDGVPTGNTVGLAIRDYE